MSETRERSLTLQSPGFPDLSLDEGEFAALQGLRGFGLAPRTLRWFDGAADGSVYRSARINRRSIAAPVLVRAPVNHPDSLTESLSQLARRFAPAVGPSRLIYGGGGLGEWFTDVVLAGGIDPTYGKDTDGSWWAEVVLSLEAGDPYFTRVEPETQTVRAGGLGRGLLKGVTSLTMLRLSSSQAMGTMTLENSGDADSYPYVTITGPGSSLTWVNDRGETITATFSLLAGDVRLLDHRRGTFTDAAGVNKYDELGPAPRFWAVPPGITTATVELGGASAGSSVEAIWQPRRWLVV